MVTLREGAGAGAGAAACSPYGGATVAYHCALWLVPRGEGRAVLLDDTRARGGGGGSPSLAVLGARQTLPALEAALGRMRRGEVALLRCAAGRLAFDSQRPPRPAEASAGVADPRGHAWAEGQGADEPVAQRHMGGPCRIRRPVSCTRRVRGGVRGGTGRQRWCRGGVAAPSTRLTALGRGGAGRGRRSGRRSGRGPDRSARTEVPQLPHQASGREAPEGAEQDRRAGGGARARSRLRRVPRNAPAHNEIVFLSPHRHHQSISSFTEQHHLER